MGNNQLPQDLDETGSHPLYGDLERRRAFPRVRLRVPVQVGLADGRVVRARIYNLSPDGIQLRCDSATAKLIHPSGKAISDSSGPKLFVALRLKHGADIRTHVLRCRVFYVLEEDLHNIIVGTMFEDLNPEHRKIIDAVMAASMEPSG